MRTQPSVTAQHIADFERDGFVVLRGVFAPMMPGDCVAFTGLTVHGAPGNTSDQQPRRALSTIWMGDDAVFAERPGKVRPLFEGHGLSPGDPMDCDYFPRVWPRSTGAKVGLGRFGEGAPFRASI